MSVFWPFNTETETEDVRDGAVQVSKKERDSEHGRRVFISCAKRRCTSAVRTVTPRVRRV